MADTETKKRPAKKDSLEAYGVGADVALKLMRDMLLFRRFEEKAEEAYAIGKIGGFCHLHIGQEGACAGSIGALQDDDYVVSSYRSHTQAIAKGIEPKAVMAELYGRADGAAGGKGGSMHMFSAEKRFMGGHGIVGGQVPLATGFGWKIKYRGEDTVSVCFMGDAAVNQGAFHESLNLAAVWNLPVIYVVENNEYGMGTAFSRVSTTDMQEKSASHGIPGISVDGQDVLATYQLFRKLAADVRGGAGPQFVNLETYRFRGHSMSDPVSGTYRSKEEVDQHTQEEDPIRVLKDKLFAGDHLDQDGLEEMDADARKIADEAADFADASPAPGP
ncbi:MAG: pyruvate dehydrogenase (acetyl-transferring) E1 component subunit alpha, partial [Gemmatimonadota bacterium]